MLVSQLQATQKLSLLLFFFFAALRAQQVNVITNGDMVVEFPQNSDLQNFSLPLGGMEPARIRIPAALLRERATSMLAGVHACLWTHHSSSSSSFLCASRSVCSCD